MNASEPHIWSSVTLYSEAVRKQRQRWFQNWLDQHYLSLKTKSLQFHRFAGEGNPNHDLIMQKGNRQTVSICSIERMEGLTTAVYVISKRRNLQLFSVSRMLRIPLFVYRIFVYEYWPAWVFYLPVLPYWIYLSIRLRSFSFFTAANPGIEMGGFFGESKTTFWRGLTERYLPKHIFVSSNELSAFGCIDSQKRPLLSADCETRCGRTWCFGNKNRFPFGVGSPTLKHWKALPLFCRNSLLTKKNSGCFTVVYPTKQPVVLPL